MTIFESLLMAHLLGDWLLQTEWQAINKTKNWRALTNHMVSYHLVMLATLGFRMGFDDFRIYITMIMFVITHTIMDRVWPVKRLMKVLRLIVDRSPERWFVMVVDQVIHLLLLGLASLYLTY